MKNIPKRVQLRKGYGSPLNTVNVAQSSKWCNPFKIGKSESDWVISKLFGKAVDSRFRGYEYYPTKEQVIERVMDLYREYIECYIISDIEQLRGKDLACWCPLDQPCHADVLLELANK